MFVIIMKIFWKFIKLLIYIFLLIIFYCLYFFVIPKYLYQFSE